MHRRGTRPIGVLTALGLIFLLIGATTGSAAAAVDDKRCRVRNLDRGTTYGFAQKAINAAKPGQRLRVKGTCVGPVSITIRLSITGVSTRKSGRATFDGAQRNTTFWVLPTGRVRVTNVTITGGRDQSGSGPWGGGIANEGRLVLRDVVVRDNRGLISGGGIHNEGVLILEGRTTIRNNVASTGTGIDNWHGQVTLKDRSVVRNNQGFTTRAAVWSRTYYRTDFTIRMRDRSAVRDNDGPGIRIEDGGLLMTGSSSVSGNVGEDVGGVLAESAHVRLAGDSSIHDNVATAGDVGGLYWWRRTYEDVVLAGVDCSDDGTDIRLFGNTPTDCLVEVG